MGDSNPHLPRIEREKLSAQTAARVAMEARKVAVVEASRCRIFKAARIQWTLAKEEEPVSLAMIVATRKHKLYKTYVKK